jgi:hypothetical protein
VADAATPLITVRYRGGVVGFLLDWSPVVGCLWLALVSGAITLFAVGAPEVVHAHGPVFAGTWIGALLFAIGWPALGYAWLWPRVGKADFFADRVEISEKPRLAKAIVVRWSDLVAFRDHSADYVRLVAKPLAVDFPADLTIPTPDENTRAAVLALLVEKCLRRHES